MAAITLGRVMFQYQGSWSSATNYVADDIVNFNGINYICVQSHINESPIRTNGQVADDFWQIFQEGLVWRGEWATGTEYFPNNIVRFGKTTYICLKHHTSSTNNRDPWYNPYNEWEEWTRGGERDVKHRVKMLCNRGPIGWSGHPFITAPSWTNGTWNGNIPWNIPAAAKRWEWNNANGSARVSTLRKQFYVASNGKLMCHGVSGHYASGQADTPRPASFNMDPSWMRDYWNNNSPTTTFKGADYKNDVNSGMPTAVQLVHGYYGVYTLYSNGTVVRNGYGGAGQTSLQSNDSTIYGATQINFPPGTFIVKISHSDLSGDNDNGTAIALDSEGFVWTWGNNYYGAMGVGSEITQGKVIGMLNDARSDGSATGSYRDYENTPKRIPKWAFNNRRIVDVWSFGRYASSCYALDEAGVLWSWGYNGLGQLGYPTNTGFRHTDGSTVPFEWGRGLSHNWNTYGGIQKIAFNSEDYPNNGYSTVYILDGQGYVWVCGYNASYLWGDNATTASTGTSGNPVRINFPAGSGLNGNVHNIWVLGADNGCGIYVRKSDGTTWGWGINSNYELTDGTATARNYPVQIAGVTNAVCMSSSGTENYPGYAALCLDGNGRYRIFTAGRNGYGVLGQGETGGTHATGGSQGAGMFHRVSGTGQYAWQPMYLPGGQDRANKIRDVQMAGGGSEGICQVLFEDGTIMNTGSNYYDGNNLNYNPIMPYNWGHANTLRKPHGSY